MDVGGDAKAVLVFVRPRITGQTRIVATKDVKVQSLPSPRNLMTPSSATTVGLEPTHQLSVVHRFIPLFILFNAERNKPRGSGLTIRTTKIHFEGCTFGLDPGDMTRPRAANIFLSLVCLIDINRAASVQLICPSEQLVRVAESG